LFGSFLSSSLLQEVLVANRYQWLITAISVNNNSIRIVRVVGVSVIWEDSVVDPKTTKTTKTKERRKMRKKEKRERTKRD